MVSEKQKWRPNWGELVAANGEKAHCNQCCPQPLVTSLPLDHNLVYFGVHPSVEIDTRHLHKTALKLNLKKKWILQCGDCGLEGRRRCPAPSQSLIRP